MSNMNNSLSVRPFHDRLDDAQLEELQDQLAAIGIDDLNLAVEGDVEELFADVSEVALDELMERLKTAGVVGDVFLPIRFKKSVKVEDLEIASAYSLITALDGIRAELGLDSDQDDRDPRFTRQRNLWKRFRRGAKLAIETRQLLDLVRM